MSFLKTAPLRLMRMQVSNLALVSGDHQRLSQFGMTNIIGKCLHVLELSAMWSNCIASALCTPAVQNSPLQAHEGILYACMNVGWGKGGRGANGSGRQSRYSLLWNIPLAHEFAIPLINYHESPIKCKTYKSRMKSAAGQTSATRGPHTECSTCAPNTSLLQGDALAAFHRIYHKLRNPSHSCRQYS